MRLTNITIRNFRCVRDLTLDLDETTVLIGENNTGKTAVLEAVRTCLERLRGRGHPPFNVRAPCEGPLSVAREEDRLAKSYPKIELLLCESGFGDSYERRMATQKPAPTAERGTSDYWRQVIDALPKGYSKPEVAAEVVGRMTQSVDPTPVPTALETILNKAVAETS